jgi:UDP:flavonoid glycosyltransferase YjiC (YdhE family)
MNILFALIPEKGHVNPYIGPAQALAARGHQVTVLAPGDISVQCAAAGLSFAPDLVPPTQGPRPTHGAELVSLIQDAPRLAAWIEQLLLTDIPPQVSQLRRAIARLHADIVVIDPLYYPAALAAHSEGLPWASVSNSLNPVLPPTLTSALLETTRALSPRRDEIFAQFGLQAAFRGTDVLSPFLTIAFTTDALCGPVPGVELVGPSFPLHQRGDEVPLLPLPDNQPIVYASFGSQIYHWPELFTKLQSAARHVHLVLSIGDLVDHLPPSPNCQFYRYAPQQALLHRANAFLTHGGANSFMEAIAANVPMLLSPMCNDQFHQAHFLSQAQIGLAADLRTLPEPEITAAIDALLTPGPIRRNLAALSRTYQSNGALRAAQLIEQLRP